MISRKRLRFVVEIDPRLLPPYENPELRALSNSEGMRRALLVPSRLLELSYLPCFMFGCTSAQFDQEREKWGGFLVAGTAENKWVSEAMQRATIVSVKICPYVLNSWFVEVRVLFRRQKQEFADIGMKFSLEGGLCGVSGGFANLTVVAS